MPRYRQRNAFQVGNYWLSQRSGSPAWYRTWFDVDSRQTRRISLGTADFVEAKQRLTDWFILENTKTKDPIALVTLAEVFARFYEHHGQTLVSASDIRRTLTYWLDFHGEATVADATEQATQRRFSDWLSKEKGLAPSSVRRALLTGKSALNWAWKRGEIEQPPYIALVAPPKPKPKGRPLEIEEVARLFACCQQVHVAVFMAFMLGTAGRTTAVMELTLDQIDLRRGLIDLNPPGRQQNNKYRPQVRLPDQLRPYIERRAASGKDGSLVTIGGQSVQSVKKAWRTLRTAAEMDAEVQAYSLRHTMARWLRLQSVPAWEVAAQLGHKAAEYSTTEIYAPFDPAYLSKAQAAIDDFLGQIACQLRVSSLSDCLL